MTVFACLSFLALFYQKHISQFNHLMQALATKKQAKITSKMLSKILQLSF